jgi:hypothetical protein
LAATVRALVLTGATPEMILAVVETHERETADALARRRASDAARQQAKRDREAMTVEPASRDVTLPVCDSRDPSPHVGESAQVVVLTSSLRSEGKPPEKPTASTPKGAGQARGTRLPDDWTPPLGLNAPDFGLTHEQYAHQVEVFRDYWRAVPGAKGRKTDWPATWRNWLRRASENSPRRAHERPHHDAKFAARQDNLAALERGADIAARFYREP